MKKILKNKSILYTFGIFFVILLIIIFIILDANNIPSNNGVSYIRFDWVETLLTLSVGILTLRLTVTIANQQKRIESDKIASEKFFRIEFIEKYQRIINNDKSPILKLKIKELDKDALKSLEIIKPLFITPIENHKPIYPKSFSIKAENAERDFEYTSKGMDKDWPDNPNKEAFCFARIHLQNADISRFEDDRLYRIEMNLIVTDIFGIEVKCKLCPWFKVLEIKEKDGKTTISFSVIHNFGYYESVKYIGTELS